MECPLVSHRSPAGCTANACVSSLAGSGLSLGHMADLFKEIIPSILRNKKDVLTNPKDYVPFVVNRTLSHHPDCLYEANAMNLLPGLDKRLQYLFLLNTIRPANRPFAKWSKPIQEQDLESIKRYFNYGDREAIAALGVLTEEQLEQIRCQTRIE
jgi:hypothetical protein